MNEVNKNEIREAAISMQRVLRHMGVSLDDLANGAPEPISSHLVTLAAACEVLSDKAVFIGQTVGD
ncbi:hypothetical protein [Asticcacaulis endophyticus]|nr:hypothetical protein [Asticcacaulis endophyticus]